MTLPADIDVKKLKAAGWFRQVRDDLCARLEAIEGEHGAQPDGDPATGNEGPPAGRFEIKPWTRSDGGGGEIGLLRGRVFEKAGVHVSIVHGHFT